MAPYIRKTIVQLQVCGHWFLILFAIVVLASKKHFVYVNMIAMQSITCSLLIYFQYKSGYEVNFMAVNSAEVPELEIFENVCIPVFIVVAAGWRGENCRNIDSCLYVVYM